MKSLMRIICCRAVIIAIRESFYQDQITMLLSTVHQSHFALTYADQCYLSALTWCNIAPDSYPKTAWVTRKFELLSTGMSPNSYADSQYSHGEW